MFMYIILLNTSISIITHVIIHKCKVIIIFLFSSPPFYVNYMNLHIDM